MRNRSVRLAYLILLAALALACQATTTYARTSGASTNRTLFHKVVPSRVDAVVASGRYVFYLQTGRHPTNGVLPTTGTLIDEHTGKRTRLDPPGCPTSVWEGFFGGPWLLVACTANTSYLGLDLYNLTSRKWLPVTLGQGLGPGNPCLTVDCSPVGVGRDWIEVQLRCDSCANAYYLQPIPPTSGPGPNFGAQGGGTATFDLDSPSGARALCSPLRYPSFPWTQPDATLRTQPGWMQTLDRFAVVADDFPMPDTPDSAYLERCGTGSRVYLPGLRPIAITKTELAWWTPGHIKGIRLPSLKRFKIPAPAGISPELGDVSLALSARKLYLEGNGTLWVAPRP